MTKLSLLQSVTTIAFFFQIMGVIALVAGTLCTLFRTGQALFKKKPISIDQIRLQIGQSIVLGLEFFVAGDIIRTIVTPDYYDIGILSILVIIRTIITYFLNQELKSLHQTRITKE